MKLTRERLKECLTYNEHTGEFVWRINKGRNICKGKIAGGDTGKGYLRISVDGVYYLSHRLVFLYMEGKVPKICDHRNRIGTDNRWNNLRSATGAENNRNKNIRKDNKTGYIGVKYNKKTGEFLTNITVDGKRKNLGIFKCKHNAFCEYVLASRKYFGEFSSV